MKNPEHLVMHERGDLAALVLKDLLPDLFVCDVGRRRWTTAIHRASCTET